MKHAFSLMQSGLLAAALLLAALAAQAQAPAWHSAVVAGGANSSATTSATDAAGNVYLAGTFTGTAAFGRHTLTSVGGADVFVAKWSPVSNEYVWAQRAGGAGADNVKSLVLNGNNLYITGVYYDEASFGSTTLPNTYFTNNYSDVYVAKLIDAGSSASFVWARRAGGAASDTAEKVVVEGANVYIAGGIGATSAAYGTAALPAGGSFIAKLTDAGASASFVWAERVAASAKALAVSGNNVYLAGSYTGSATSFGGTTLPNASSDDIFVAKLTDGGTTTGWSWARHAGGASFDYANALAVSGSQVYVVGSFLGTGSVFGSTSLASAGNYDVLVAKLTDAGSSGSWAWAQRAGGDNLDLASAVVVSGSSVLVAGFTGSATSSYGGSVLSSSGVFLTKLLDTGTGLAPGWVVGAGGFYADEARSVSVHGSSVFVTGGVRLPATFGPHALSSPTASNQTGFLASVQDRTLLAAAPASTFTLKDALGRTVRTQVISARAGTSPELNLTGLTPGVYTVQIQAEGNTTVRRLVIE